MLANIFAVDRLTLVPACTQIQPSQCLQRNQAVFANPRQTIRITSTVHNKADSRYAKGGTG